MAAAFGVSAAELIAGSRRRPAAHARAAASRVAVTGLGLLAAHVARALGVTPMAVLHAVARRGDHLRAHGLDSEVVAREMRRKVD